MIYLDLSNVKLYLKKRGYFIEVDRGYLGYGLIDGDHAVERLSHFLDWDEVESVRWLRRWCKDFLNTIIADHLFDRQSKLFGCPSSDRFVLSPDCQPNPGGYCIYCHAGRDHS